VDKRLDYVRTILSSGQVLLSLLNDILDLSKIESGKFQFSATEFEPAAVLTQTSALFSGAAHTKGLQMAHQWQGPPGQHYLCDTHRLHQMLSNLVGNAIKFTPHGSVHISATEVQRDGTSALLEFSVRDTGIGIAKDKLGLLFKPFSQADTSTTREFGGSGLGLSIVSRLAQAMGGSVGVQSEAGTGSRFWFRVRAEPIAQEKAAEQDKTWSAKFPGGGEPQFAGHVLVAEDDPINAKLIAVILRTLGLQMSLTTDGQQVADAIMHNTLADGGAAPNLILMDMQMPVLNGQQATLRIRQWEAAHGKPRIPIIALTANAFEEDREQCLAAGMDAFLTKPVSINALKDALTQWLPAPHTGLADLDGAAFSTLVDELLPLLAKNKFAALARFKALQALTTGTALAQDVDALAAPMMDMKFALVRERLLILANSQGCGTPDTEMD
jgi:CheY-like chemotaxis protein